MIFSKSSYEVVNKSSRPGHHGNQRLCFGEKLRDEKCLK
jgi:hypothetical protein